MMRSKAIRTRYDTVMGRLLKIKTLEGSSMERLYLRIRRDKVFWVMRKHKKTEIIIPTIAKSPIRAVKPYWYDGLTI